MGGGGDLLHGGLEGGFVRLGGAGEAADLPHELQGGVADLRAGDRRIEVEERLDVSAHGGPTSSALV